MEAKKLLSGCKPEGAMNVDKVIDFAMSKLFQLAEYVCSKYSLDRDEPAASQEVAPTIRFRNENKTAMKQVESNACISSFEREQPRLKIKMVEGELFK